MIVRQLKDGSSVLIRLIRAEDKETLRRGVAELSSRSLYFRFLRSVKSLSEKELKYLTEVDRENHFAILATDAEQSRGLGVARFIRLADQPQVAEFAITVADSHHGLGLASLLLAYIRLFARRARLKTLRAWIHRDNFAMGHLFRKAGGRLVRTEGPVQGYDLEL